MLTAISRYGARALPNTEQIITGCKARGEFIQGPQIAQFEAAFARRAGVAPAQAITASYGRMAFYYILKALDLPAGAEIVLPALTFWVVPELARVAGLKVAFADVDPATFTMDPAALERAITPQTRAVVPTHLYGLPCDMDAIMAIARRHHLRVIEDCAHALGATYDGRPVGTFGDAGFFSFQTLKPLNCYGGGLALVQDPAVAALVRELAEREPWPDRKRVENRLLIGKLQRIFIRPDVFTVSAFPILWVSSLIGANPDVYLWEEIRSLTPLPESYPERFPNVQAAIGLAALEQLEGWTDRTRRHAGVMDRALAGLDGVSVPAVPAKRTHVYYQYCVYAPKRDELVVRCVRRGVDIETLHVDVCSDMDLFAACRVEPAGAPGARRAAEAMQIPVYSTLTDEQAQRVARVVRSVLAVSR
ncbi:MAG TPA: aminotransferase class I/II-fold pyridoxal phosphate-dependent enzyme [Vicinamibacterales bacterium]|jgi:dTDP-4-amino-4,6-dideoxygalactose transaminase|nr:aminotransferase class I/II-fold pyridoxal phosphate-dependent enzyme [Vicinamibacterales bacterium]